MRASVILAFAALPGLFVAAGAQSERQTQPTGQSLGFAPAYRGAFVCEKLPLAADVLHVPADLVIRGDQVQFGRPMFNLRGTRVVGSEMGTGSVDERGSVKITSSWSFGGITVHGSYAGMLTSSGGNLSGTQTWRQPNGAPRSRTCQIALVPA